MLHHRPYREASVIANLLVDGIGRVDAVVRLGSGRRSLKSILQPFQPLIFVVSGRHELKSLSQVEAMAPAIPLTGHSLYAGFYLNEILMRIIHHGGDALFFPYHQTLMALADTFAETPLRYFELSLLEELGAMPSLIQDGHGNALTAELRYQLLAEQGFWPVVDHVSRAFHYPGQSLINLCHRCLTADDLPVAKRLMRQLLQPLLGDKPLRSRQLFMAQQDTQC